MPSLSRERGITLLETAGIAVVMSVASIVCFGAADTYAKQIALGRAAEKAISQITELPYSISVNHEGALGLILREEPLRVEIEEVIDSVAIEIEEAFPDLQANSFKIEASLFPVFIDPNTGTFEGMSAQPLTTQRGLLAIHPEIDRKSSLVERVMILADTHGIGESSVLAEPTPQSIFLEQGWKFLPQALVCAIRIIIDTQGTPSNFLRDFISQPQQLFKVQVMHLRGSAQ